MTTKKAARLRLARAEMLLMLATKCETWARDIAGHDKVTPFADWGADDPFVDLARRYALTPGDLVRLLDRLGGQVERQALRAGYEEAWVVE